MMIHAALTYLWLALLLCTSVNAAEAKDAIHDCQIPSNIDNKLQTSLYKCMHLLRAENIPIAFGKNSINPSLNTQAVYAYFHNQTKTSQSLILSIGIPDAYNIVIWQVNKSGKKKLLELNENSSFYERDIFHRILKVSVELESYQTTEWYISYQTHAKTPLHIELVDVKKNLQIQSREDFINGSIFGIMTALIFLLIPLTLFFSTTISYGFYLAIVLSNLLFVAQIDGYNFAYLWPDHPQMNMRAPFLLTFISLISHILFAINFLQLSWRYPLLYKIHLLALGLGLVILIIPLQLSASRYEILAAIVSAYYILAVVTAWRATRDQVSAARFYFFGACSVMIFYVGIFGMSVIWENIFPNINTLVFPKIGIILETFFFIMTLLSQLLDFNRSKKKSHLDRLAETEQLLKTEQERTQALELAKMSQLQLASASHDILQPLASIRFALAALQLSDEKKMVNDHIEKTLNYAQTLLADILNQSRKDWGTTTETISLSVLFDQLHNEFKPQADEKKLKFNVVCSKMEFSGSSLLLYRILNNLLSNSIRYTNRGRVCLGVRRRKLGIELQIGDTGSGIQQPIKNSLLLPFQQGEQKQEGYGLGLFIVKSLCHQCGYQFSVRSKQGIGTLFSIFIPHHHH